MIKIDWKRARDTAWNRHTVYIDLSTWVAIVEAIQKQLDEQQMAPKSPEELKESNDKLKSIIERS